MIITLVNKDKHEGAAIVESINIAKQLSASRIHLQQDALFQAAPTFRNNISHTNCNPLAFELNLTYVFLVHRIVHSGFSSSNNSSRTGAAESKGRH